MTVRTTVLDNIGLLVTNDHTVGEGALGLLRDASVVFAGDRVASVGAAGQTADARIDAAGACVIPGFVDSHTHLVFAGDRGDEFAARMAGRPYEAGGIRTSVAATRAASDEQLTLLTATRRTEARRAGITTLEIKSGYGLDAHHEARCLEVGQQFTGDTTFLGAHVVPPEFEGRTDDYVHHVCTDMLAAAAPHARWIDAFCEVGAFDVDQSRAVLAAGKAAGLGMRLHANQLGHGPGVQLAVEMGCASADHCTYLSDDDIQALSGSETVATFLPATDFSTRQPYPDARRVIDAGVSVALATNCNPGSSYTTSMSFCLALAVRDLRMSPEEALLAATVGGANALRRTDVGRIAAGFRADMVVLAAPSYTHFVYRPGVPLISAVIEAGHLT
ncbi:MAG TPA: imidazolonepropionase [Ilumatobacteraceae bacterium]|nr:imidazolonepropionase [Ilumatobacteraceae bacterium]HRB03520.1 imidazolonepropionase [Ilumatobacteraceae bacterium]